MEVAQAELAAAAARQQRINSLLAAENEKLAAIDAARKQKGRGRPKVAEASRYAGIERRIARLERGLLPEEPEPHPTAAAPGDLRASAAQHPRHHAAPQHVPPGRDSNFATGNFNGARQGGGGGRGGGAVDAEQDGGGSDDDDDEESADFRHFYAISSNQRAWNSKVAREYAKGGAVVVQPPDLLRSGCDPALVGLGTVHIFAPHLHLGLPLPPCPRCGWDAVDSGQLTCKGWKPARRVSLGQHRSGHVVSTAGIIG